MQSVRAYVRAVVFATSKTVMRDRFASCAAEVGVVRFISFLLLYILATSKVTSGQLPTCDSAHS